MDKRALSTIRFWGAATSAHQVEGKNHNQWSRWELQHASELAKGASTRFASWLPAWDRVSSEATQPENYVSGIAIDHWTRYEEDYEYLSKMNMTGYRLSIEWSRLEPQSGAWNESAFEHYRSMLRALKKRDISPIVTLWHFTNPIWFEDIGGFSKRANIHHFLKYVEKAIVELGEHLEYVITINEPNVYAGLAFVEGEFPPNQRSWWRGIRVERNLVESHNQAAKIIKAIRKNILVGIAQNVSHVRLGNKRPISRLMAAFQQLFWNEYALNRTDDNVDFIGCNYYFSDRWTGGLKPDNEMDKISDMAFMMRPADIEHVVKRLFAKYGKPIIITENGVADANDKFRKWWIWETLAALSRAINDGVKIDGYLYWSLLDNFEWAHGFWPRFGLIAVDRSTLKRTMRPSATWFGGVIQSVRLSSEDH